MKKLTKKLKKKQTDERVKKQDINYTANILTFEIKDFTCVTFHTESKEL